jgi:hypothetical protein
MLPAEVIGFRFLLLLLQRLLSLLCLLRLTSSVGGLLFGGGRGVLNVRIVVWPSAGRAQAVQVILDVMVAELADLKCSVSTALLHFVITGSCEFVPGSHRDMA